MSGQYFAASPHEAEGKQTCSCFFKHSSQTYIVSQLCGIAEISQCFA